MQVYYILVGGRVSFQVYCGLFGFVLFLWGWGAFCFGWVNYLWLLSSTSLCLQRELVLYPDKNGRVSDLLEEARKQVELVDKENGKFRWVQ